MADVRSLEAAGLAAATPSGMKEELLLVSWLIVLLRTREDGQTSFEWAYQGENNTVNKCLSTEVMTDLRSTVGQTAAAIARNIAPLQRSATALLLSTGALSQSSEEPKDERKGTLHLETQYNDGRLEIRPVWQSETMLPYTATRHINSLVDTVQMVLSNPDASIEDSLRPTASDLTDIWSWNHKLPPSYDFGMHEEISRQARKTPDKVAIDSWDGSLTYGEIERYSTFVATTLKEMGAEPEDFIPVCFEKSRWTIVAVLAVMKAGCTFAMMDPTLPLARLQNMAEQVNAKTMVSSSMQRELSKEIIPDGKFFVVEEDAFTDVPGLDDLPTLPTVPASTIMYLIFTSGSTGTPKGVKVSHGSYTSSAFPRAKAVGYNEESRVLDFASYAFDVSIDSMLLTLGNNGCLCIPSDEDRLNDINGVIRNMRVNYAGITPSVARILEPDVITSLSALGLGGEAASARDVNVWGQETRIIIGYGPCECTIGCTVNSSAATGRDYISIGPGNGAAIWIVNPNDHEELMPVGAVGELLVEGPIVGQGYLNDPEKTAAAFIEDPKWLVAGHKDYAGRQGRLYKTGDLGKYDPDGLAGILFAGRKDTQVKLRGQRVELGEIESQLKARLPSEATIIAEVIVPQGSGNQATLVAFVSSQATKGVDTTELSSVELPEELGQALSEADAEVKKVLPRYMVPTAYIPVSHIPVLISGKTDRRRLRQFGTSVDLRELDQGAARTADRELTDLEQRLRQAWSQTLKLDAETIRPDDNFFALGGDSLAAMRLASVCRAQGLDLSVANTFGHPTLSAMASVVLICDVETQTETPAFSLISQAAESACQEAAQVYGFEQSTIEDIYPCTPTQESLFTFSLKSVRAYVAQRLACIPADIDLDAWKHAWEEVVTAIPILRTRVAQLQEPGLQQVVLKDSISWKHSTDLAQYLEEDRKEKMNLGERLARYAIIEHPGDDKRYMVWTVHHVLYDGWSEPIILKKVSEVLQNQQPEVQAQMRDFVKYVRDTDEAAMEEFWRRELKGAVGPQFPRLPSRDYLPIPDGQIERQIPLETSAGSPFTMATLIRAAWALVASQYTGNDDVVFGETLTGRDISLAGVESIVGPLIATVPIRIHINRASTVESYLQSVQQGILSRTPYQHMGMQNIRKVSHDAQHACEAPTGLVVQPEPEYVGSELGFELGDVVREALHFNPYPLMLGCGIRKGGFRICASFDSSLVEVSQMERILAQIEVACSQLSKGLSRRIDEISCLPAAELNQIWQWNQTPPLSLDESSRRLRAEEGIKEGSAYPQAVVPWVCDARNPSLLSPIGCVGELWLEGAILSGETVESPAWLVAGSSERAGRTGRVQATGDLVQLQEDNSLIFVGRKENVVSVQGHAVNIAEVEAQFTKNLPTTVRVAAAVSQPSGAEPELVVFIEQPSSTQDSIELMSTQHEIRCDTDSQSCETTICATIPVSHAVALKKLDKFIHDSLPSYMAPFAYIVVDRMPIHSVLNQLASSIPRDLLVQLRDTFKQALAKASAQTNLTPSEAILRSAWATILKLSPEQIDVDDNFFRLGGDSVLAMKLVSSLRAQGHGLTVADIFQRMRLGDAAKVLRVNVISKEKAQPYRPFSTLGQIDHIESFLAENIRPKLADPQWSIRDVLPVTDSQALDIRATVQAPRTSIQYTMLYMNQDVDRARLLRACHDLVQAHDILRTVFISHESSFLQVVVDKLDCPVAMHQATTYDMKQDVASICKSHSESAFHLGSSFTQFLHVEDPTTNQSCLIIGLSHALYDGVSLPLLLRDLETLYIGTSAIPTPTPFSSYISHTLSPGPQTKALTYWRTLLQESTLTTLAGPAIQPGDKSIFHTKPIPTPFPFHLEEITTATLLTSAWALLLARRLHTDDITFGAVTSGRTLSSLPDIDTIMGPCYQLTPTRVRFQPTWHAMDLLRYVQNQSAESAEYDFLGFDKIAAACGWDGYFDSVVHHQDWHDFDTMPFAGGECKVDILNPDGDAAYPMKVVSFVKEGVMHVGVVGSERDVGFVDETLEQLVKVVEALTLA
ncbi:nonribosomal siderophore peptide synthase Sid2 [Aspergillus sclerotiicarbonarius CBS 121057]|uniref:Nonribosomal siderophore peptide synthase Sid2 n=1 Tax=Aspergillus sclerotiicarbonarius (strain CBS 121057 / IBT 28362) TaxID=1448318 RepID=A0A319ERU9_ASPSB|nr:nonribosomal siderophore peptide synthase Sid2 [Aspergillus sclerotiicarbonarius CBS 121057]